jgi:hypothetical protein
MAKDEDATLLEAAKRGDRRARERLVANHLHVVRSVAFHYAAWDSRSTTSCKKAPLGLLGRSTSTTRREARTSSPMPEFERVGRFAMR